MNYDGGYHGMPIYEYKCDGCGAVLEALQNFSDEPLTTCSRCQGPLKKLISQSSFHLKGSGWYVTDYADKPKSKSDTSANTPDPPASTETSKPADAASGSDD
jgi:putative FmdB family regulatory protein